MAMRGLLIGLLISSYFIAQFFSSPILGSLSDRKGRKKIIIFTLSLAFIGFVIGGIGIVIQNVYLLFFSRILAGSASGNYAVAQAVITDISDEGSKTKNFGLINMAYGSGFIIGPFIGGKLSDPHFASWCDYATPFWFAGLLCLFNILWMAACFKETLRAPLQSTLSVFKGIKNLQKALQIEPLRMIFITMFLFSFGWGFFCEFVPLFLMQKYQFRAPEIGNFYAYMGGLVAISQGLLIRPFLKRFSPRFLLLSGLFLLGTTLPILILLEEAWMLLWILPVILFFEALIYPNASTCVSNLSNKENQGEVLGIHQSVQSAAIAISPLFSGSLVANYPYLPITVGSFMTVLAGSLFLLSKKKEPILSEIDELDDR